MKISMLLLIAISLLLQVTIDANVLGASWFAEPQDDAAFGFGKMTQEDENEKESDSPAAAAAEADKLANEVTQEMQVKIDDKNAKEAAGVAKQAAHIATKVADHSVKVTTHAKSALKHALHALHEARVDTSLDSEQTASLKKAENKLEDATKTADFGKVKKIKEDAEDLKKKAMKGKMDRKKKRSEIEEMRKDIKELRKKLKKKGGDAEGDKELEQLLKDLEQLEDDLDGKTDAEINDEMKAEIERLRDAVDKYDAKQEKPKSKKATPVREKGIDIDTQMPYGDLEPFGREDTAQELTESSVRESDQMVDQLERAEVAEEKRAVFRALTRLRGAAITSFDGVAKSQTGNIDEYNKVNKWRRNHPLHHLADEESDVTKWAFPDNADLLQASKKADLLQASKKADLLQAYKKADLLQQLLQVPENTTNSTKTAVVLKPVVLSLKLKSK